MSDLVRIYDLARQLNVQNQDVIAVMCELSYDVNGHSTRIDATAVNLVTIQIKKSSKPKLLERYRPPKTQQKKRTLTGTTTIQIAG